MTSESIVVLLLSAFAASDGRCEKPLVAPGAGSYTHLDRIWEFMNHKGFNR